MRFEYLRLPLVNGAPAIPRPILKVRVVGPKDWGHAWMLVDSGADETVLPMRFLERLGVLFGEERAVLGGIGEERIEGKVGAVRLELGGSRFTFNSRVVGSIELPIPVLGHRDFFERYFVSFEAAKRRFFVSDARHR